MISLRWQSPGKGISFKKLLEVAQNLGLGFDINKFTSPTDPKLMISEGIYASEGFTKEEDGY